MSRLMRLFTAGHQRFGAAFRINQAHYILREMYSAAASGDKRSNAEVPLQGTSVGYDRRMQSLRLEDGAVVGWLWDTAEDATAVDGAATWPLLQLASFSLFHVEGPQSLLHIANFLRIMGAKGLVANRMFRSGIIDDARRGLLISNNSIMLPYRAQATKGLDGSVVGGRHGGVIGSEGLVARLRLAQSEEGDAAISAFSPQLHPLILLHGAESNPSAEASNLLLFEEDSLLSGPTLSGHVFACNNTRLDLLVTPPSSISSSLETLQRSTLFGEGMSPTVHRLHDRFASASRTDTNGMLWDGLSIDTLCGASTASSSIALTPSDVTLTSTYTLSKATQSASRLPTDSRTVPHTPTLSFTATRAITRSLSMSASSSGPPPTLSTSQPHAATYSVEASLTKEGNRTLTLSYFFEENIVERKYKEVKEATERGASAVLIGGGSILSPRAGGQAGVAMALLRVGERCSEEEKERQRNELSEKGGGGGGGGRGASDRDGDIDMLDAPLSPFIHPLAFPVGKGHHRYFIGAIIGNCFIIPIVSFFVLRWPIIHFLQRWGLPEQPSLSDVHQFLGWPSVVALPLSTLAEGTATSIVELIRSKKAVESLVGIVGAFILSGGIIAWSYILFFKIYRLPIALTKAPRPDCRSCVSVLNYLFSPVMERGPREGANDDDDNDDDEDDEEMTDAQNGLKAKRKKKENPLRSPSVSPTEAAFIEDTLERMAHLFGDGFLLWSEWSCLLCATAVGAIEGASDSILCDRSSITLLIFALIQSILSCATMVPMEFVVQLAIAVLLTLLSVSAVMDVYSPATTGFSVVGNAASPSPSPSNDSEGGGGGFLSRDDQDAIGLVINCLSFFGMVVGLIIALLKLLRRRAALLQLKGFQRRGLLPPLSPFHSFVRRLSTLRQVIKRCEQVEKKCRGQDDDESENHQPLLLPPSDQPDDIELVTSLSDPYAPHYTAAGHGSDLMDLFLGELHSSVKRMEKKRKKKTTPSPRAPRQAL